MRNHESFTFLLDHVQTPMTPSTSSESTQLPSHEDSKESNFCSTRGHNPETPEQVVTRLVVLTIEQALRSRLKCGVPAPSLKHGNPDWHCDMFCMATLASSRMEPIHLSHVIPRTTDDSVVRPYFCVCLRYFNRVRTCQVGHLEWCWGLDRGTLILDSPYNLQTCASTHLSWRVLKCLADCGYLQ